MKSKANGAVTERSRPAKARRLTGFDVPTVWHEFTPLAVKHGACNLGQGFPDWPCPQFAKDALKKAVQQDFNQYARSAGHPALVEAISRIYSPRMNRTLDPMTEITISVGASEGLFAVMQAVIDEGDEVILLEPAFDLYPAQVQMAGGKSVFV
eukprot:CAMPEP_0113944048 /NCGR_PEP_ID=MMETSP1339-20121228/30607_1 /TAXON_ID=94617 /ORGANISM="Fibrocapsa japonica" /LENGTH=152 /DNA_ID=CAMNT_0000949109 /DNA_START=153 /DNA_END=608 /DNA_ORIENTATION=+ /assembly_acc=CAM_ASM_000762